MKEWFRGKRDVRRAAQPPGHPGAFERPPALGNSHDAETSHPVRPPRDPEGDRDADRDFVIRYGDPLDDG